MTASAITEIAQRRLPGTLEFLQRMVAINSFTENASGVNALGELTASEFATLGFKASFYPASHPNYGRHLLLERVVATGAPSIAMISHLDTVFTAEEEARNHFAWRPEGRRIYGPGTNDIKGGTALIHLVLTALQWQAPAIFEATNWFVVLNASEETISADFAQLCRAQLPKDTLACLVFEADGGDSDDSKLVTARKGRATFNVEVEGRAAHSGGDHARGANAIVELSRVVQELARLTDYDAGVTVNVGAISGGTVTNRVPHFATAELEMRAFSPEAYQRTKAAILGLAGEGQVRSSYGHACLVSVRVNDETVPWPPNPQTDALFALWQEVGESLSFPVQREERGGLSDGNLLWNSFPTLDGLGPRGENSHCSEQTADGRKEQEWVDAESFVPKTTLNVLAILRLLAMSRS